MASLLGQTLVAQTPLTNYIPWIALLVTGYLLYMIFFKKDSKYIELVTTQRVLIPLFMLVALALVPSSVMALFGFAETAIMTVVQIITAFLVSIAVVAGITFVARFLNLV